MFKGEILVSKLEPLMTSYNYNFNQLNGESFRMLFDLNVKSNGSMVGASGAIMGILVAFGMLNPNAELMMLFLPIPLPAYVFGICYLLYSIYGMNKNLGNIYRS